jgi:hypothetical protein
VLLAGGGDDPRLRYVRIGFCVENVGATGAGAIYAAPASGGILQSVSCPDDSDCWAVGRCSAPTAAMCAGSSSLIELYDTVLPDSR